MSLNPQIDLSINLRSTDDSHNADDAPVHRVKKRRVVVDSSDDEDE